MRVDRDREDREMRVSVHATAVRARFPIARLAVGVGGEVAWRWAV